MQARAITLVDAAPRRFAGAASRRGIGCALTEHARASLAGAGATRLRVPVDAADGDGRTFPERMSFVADALTLERRP